MRIVIPFVLLIFGAVVSASAQEVNEPQHVDLPPEIMQQVVSRIVRYYFNPLVNPEPIYISDRELRKEWLPAISGRTFVVLTDKEISGNRDAFFFKRPAKYRNHFEIDFGYGDPSCSGEGDTWEFRIHRGRVRLWRPRVARGWGMGCGHASGDGREQTSNWF